MRLFTIALLLMYNIASSNLSKFPLPMYVQIFKAYLRMAFVYVDCLQNHKCSFLKVLEGSGSYQQEKGGDYDVRLNLKCIALRVLIWAGFHCPYLSNFLILVCPMS